MSLRPLRTAACCGTRSRAVALTLLAGLLGAFGIVACARMPVPQPTAVNPTTFPQALPATVPSPPAPQELPPPVTENHTFVTIDGHPQYKIGVGDVLEVLVTKGVTQERSLVAVRTNGRISIGFVEVRVDGLTADQAADEITRALSVYFRNAQVEVLVKEFNSKKVTILGGVTGTPRGGIGTFPLSGRTSLLELIAKAGGVAPSASLDRVRVTRASGKSYVVNMFRYVQEGDLSQEFILDTGDVVFVPERAPGEERRVFLLGEVKNPGAVPLYPSMTVSQLVSQAGGWSETGLYREARIIRGDLRNPDVVSVDLARLILDGDHRIDQYLKPNDVVFIPRTPIGDWNALMAQIRPTLEIISLSLQPPILYQTLTGD